MPKQLAGDESPMTVPNDQATHSSTQLTVPSWLLTQLELNPTGELMSGDDLNGTTMHWAQDVDERYTHIAGRLPGFACDAILGKSSIEAGLLPLVDEPALAAAWRAARRSFSAVISWHRTVDGERRYCSSDGAAIFDAAGEYAGYQGTTRDVTDAIRAAQRSEFERGVMLALAETDCMATATPRILSSIGNALAWACGARWQYDAHPRSVAFIATLLALEAHGGARGPAMRRLRRHATRDDLLCAHELGRRRSLPCHSERRPAGNLDARPLSRFVGALAAAGHHRSGDATDSGGVAQALGLDADSCEHLLARADQGDHRLGQLSVFQLEMKFRADWR